MEYILEVQAEAFIPATNSVETITLDVVHLEFDGETEPDVEEIVQAYIKDTEWFGKYDEIDKYYFTLYKKPIWFVECIAEREVKSDA